MDNGQNVFSQPTFWVSIVSAIAAWVAAFFAFANARRANRTLRLAEQQEQRRLLNLRSYLIEGFSRILPTYQARGYAFSISIGNPSDSNNAIVRAELRIGYTSDKNAYMAIKVPPDGTIAQSLGLDPDALLQIPARIDAHQTIAGRLAFRGFGTFRMDGR